MAVTVINTLYPPLIETFQPAFLYDTNALITFSLSSFNSINDITNIHVSVVDQRNNANVLKTQKEPKRQKQNNTENTIDSYYGITNGLLIAEIPIFDKTNTAKQKKGLFQYDPIHNLYSIDLFPELLSENNYWNNNQYYQVQIRFDSCNNFSWHNNQADFAGYMLENREYFSEWSSVTLIKPILEPVLSITQLNTQEKTYTYPGSFHISGSLVFIEPENQLNGLSYPETERLQSYRIIVTKDEQSVIDSDWIYARQNIAKTEKTTIDYLLNLIDQDEGDNLIVTIYCRTNNGYIFSQAYELVLLSYNDILENIRWNNFTPTEDNANSLNINQEDGVVTIAFSADKINNNFTKAIIYFRRACSKDNFKTWDLIYQYNYTNVAGKIIVPPFQDYTVGSLYEYQYSAQICIINPNEQWDKIYKSEKIYPIFHEMLLMRQNKQIAIRYNEQISSWKPTINRQKIDTLGGRYPKFVENAVMNYKTYSISGLISAEADFNRHFLDETQNSNVEIYDKYFDTTYLLRNDTLADGENKYPEINEPHGVDINGVTVTGVNLYKINNLFDGQLNQQHDSYPHNHWYWEREFREQLVAWLNDGEPKLYRSMPEGNIAVMLTDINLTPNTQLGRQLYNFSATMYEVGDGYSLEELNNLNIINIPTSDAIYLTDVTLNEEEEEAIIGTLQTKIWQFNISSSSNVSNWINGTASTHNTSDLWADMSVKEQLDEYYSNTQNQVTFNSIKLNNIDIQFTTSPNYYSYNNKNFTKSNVQTDWLGYVIYISWDTSDGVDVQEIFVNEKGFYHISDTVNIKNIQIAAGQALITCECQYRILPKSSAEEPSQPIPQKTIVGQYKEDMLPLDVDIISLIYQNHEKIEYQNGLVSTKYSLDSCKGLLLDITPYAYIEYKEENDNTNQHLIIGQTGVFNAFEDWPLTSLKILGRRMIIINPNDPNNGQYQQYPYHIEEWQCYKDSIDNIDNPKINGVYGEQIYYIDGKWYPIDINTGIAKVPIYGTINYYGDLVKAVF